MDFGKNKRPRRCSLIACGRRGVVVAVGNGGNKGDPWDVSGVESFSTGCQEFLRWPSLRFLCSGRKAVLEGSGRCCLGQTGWHHRLHRRRLFNFFVLPILFNPPPPPPPLFPPIPIQNIRSESVDSPWFSSLPLSGESRGLTTLFLFNSRSPVRSQLVAWSLSIWWGDCASLNLLESNPISRVSEGKKGGYRSNREDTDRRNWRHTHERIRGNNGLTHGGQWRNSRNVIMVHGARKVVTAIMGNCPRRMVPQWRISLPLTTDCPNTSCSPRQDNERPLSGSGFLYSAVVVYQHRLDDGPLQSLSLSLSRLLPVFISFPPFWFTSFFLFFSLPLCTSSSSLLLEPRYNPLTRLQICTRIMLTFESLLPSKGTTGSRGD